MSDRGGEIPRARMGEKERELRSQLAKLVHGSGLIRGTLAVRERTCGKPGCKCARGEKHASLYLVAAYDGKYRQVFIPSALEDAVRLWVANHQRARELLEEISRLQYERIRKREL
jgi:hypothetical protein